MRVVSSARIFCRDSTGSQVAAIVLWPDDEVDPSSDTASLIELDGELAELAGETECQLREDAVYTYEIVGNENESRDLRLRCHLARRSQRQSRENEVGQIATRSYCGSLLLEVVEGDASDGTKPPIATAQVDVRSIKIDYRNQFRGMLRYIASVIPELTADARSSVKAPMKSNFELRGDKNWFQLQLEFLRDILEGHEFSLAMQRLTSLPVNRLQNDDSDLQLSKISRFSARQAQSLISGLQRVKLPAHHPLQSLAGIDSLPAVIRGRIKTANLDVPENRFAKYVLEEFKQFLTSAQTVFFHAGPAWGGAKETADRLAQTVQHWLDRPLFAEVSALVSMPLGSPVLHRKAGYRELLRWWLRFRSAAEVSWNAVDDLFLAGQRNVAALYEYWLFLVLLQWFAKRFSTDARPVDLSNIMLGIETDTPLIQLRRGVSIGPFVGSFSSSGRRLNASLTFNKKFPFSTSRHTSGSWTRSLHPDYTLTFWPELPGLSVEDSVRICEEQELSVHLHIDAKYRVDDLNALFGPEDATDPSPPNYKRDDLLKMHAYRDGIKRSEGAYILYPGPASDRANQFRPDRHGRDRWPSTMWAFHEIVPSIGAFAVVPGEHGEPLGFNEFEIFLEQIISNLANRASFREARASRLFEDLRRHQVFVTSGEDDDPGPMLRDAPELDADSFRSEIASEIVILTVALTADQKAWTIRHDGVPVFLGSRDDALSLVRVFARASHLLTSTKEEPSVGLLRIAKKLGSIWKGSELAAMGYPVDAGGGDEDLFALFEVVSDPVFSSFEWDVNRIGKAHELFLQKQRPSQRSQLRELSELGARLLSLEDLRLALVRQ